MRCCICHRDLDAIYQDNMSETPGYPICEDCYDYRTIKFRYNPIGDKDYSDICDNGD